MLYNGCSEGKWGERSSVGLVSTDVRQEKERAWIVETRKA
jgi:hypothetical protein